MKQNEKSLATRRKVLAAAGALFAEKGFEAATMQDIMAKSGLSKGAIYHHFRSKEEIMQALGDQMFFENNPFEIVRGRTDLTGLQKIRAVLLCNQADSERAQLNAQALPILKNPHILAAALEANRRVLTPLWLELLEEGQRDGSIQSAYPKELSELLPLINFWLLPSVCPATPEELLHKFRFVLEVLEKMGLPLLDEEMTAQAEKQLAMLCPKP